MIHENQLPSAFSQIHVQRWPQTPTLTLNLISISSSFCAGQKLSLMQFT